jgi:hypothetical protein
MDGSMGAGLVDHLIYADTGQRVEVKTLSLQDACSSVGCVPHFVKMDIEGSELAVIESSLRFLSDTGIHFSFDSYHRLCDESYTYMKLENLFASIGYKAESTSEFGQMFTYATPPGHLPTGQTLRPPQAQGPAELG